MPDDLLASWNDGAVKHAIVDFVTRVTKQGSRSTTMARFGASNRCRSRRTYCFAAGGEAQQDPTLRERNLESRRRARRRCRQIAWPVHSLNSHRS